MSNEGLSASSIAALFAATLQPGAPGFKFDHNWIKLHVGHPGADGTGNPAVTTDRMNADDAWGGTLAAPSATNDTAITGWTLAASETPTHYSSWSLEADGTGTFQFSGQIATSGSFSMGDPFSVDIGQATVTMQPAT